jgi:hypothetical protein
MSETNNSDLERIKELWPRLPWYIKQRILIMARYYMIYNLIINAWGKVNLAWVRMMIVTAEPENYFPLESF